MPPQDPAKHSVPNAPAQGLISTVTSNRTSQNVSLSRISRLWTGVPSQLIRLMSLESARIFRARGTQCLPICPISMKNGDTSCALTEEPFPKSYPLRMIAQIVRAAIRSCSRNHACASSVVSRGCQAMKYGKALISRGGSTTRRPAIPAAIFANLRGKVRTKSV